MPTFSDAAARVAPGSPVRRRDWVPVLLIAAMAVMLAGMVIPAMRTIELTRASRKARADLQELKEGIERFSRDAGEPPTRDRSGRPCSLMRLAGPGNLPKGAYYRSDSRQGLLADHLYRNEPQGLRIPGYAGWNGPYWSRPTPDPWGDAYTVVAYPLNGDEARRCVIVCAGPNSMLDADYSAALDPVAAGDDLIEVVDPP